MPKQFKTGQVVGKFYPPHKGHKYLIDTAQDQCEKVTVLLIDTIGQSIPIKLRETWLKEIHPLTNVLVVPDIGDDDNSQAWAQYTLKILGQVPDAVFTSENYGDAYAKFMGCKHILVDKARTIIPISGTKVRANPQAAWEYLEPCVRAYFTRRICVVGAESTGTTTLARALADCYKTVWVPEYGRVYCEGKMTGTEGNAWLSKEFKHIANMQIQIEDGLARCAGKIMFCDTDAFATSIWHERYMQSQNKDVEDLAREHNYDLYIVTNTDIPFVQDGTRDGQHIRQWMHERFVEKLKGWNKKYIVVSGSLNERIAQSQEAISDLLRGSDVKNSFSRV
jgi:HTH-type transcriptional repressor of NAD biosynthesis genes